MQSIKRLKFLLFSLFIASIGILFSLDSNTRFVFNNDKLLLNKSVDFMENISLELFEKTGVSLYVFAANKMDSNKYLDFKNELIKSFSPPFVSIVLLKENKKIDVFTSNNELLDSNKVYWEYMVPLLPKNDSIPEDKLLGAIIFNGYVESVDLIANKFNVVIEHNISKDEKGPRLIAKGILYFMLFSLLGLFFVISFFGRKKHE